jgi:multimeric flavodoxin WrbA
MARKSGRSIVILNGSPRVRGNSAVVVGWLERELQKRGLTPVRHDLYRLRFAGCAHCDSCKKVPRRPGCRLKDDFAPVLDRIAKAPGIVVASPVYCWSVSGCTSAALDRFYSLFKDERSLIAGKKVAGVFTAGGDAFDGMDLCVDMLRRICEYGEAEYVGTLAGVSCDTPGSTRKRSDLRRQAASLATEF